MINDYKYEQLPLLYNKQYSITKTTWMSLHSTKIKQFLVRTN